MAPLPSCLLVCLRAPFCEDWALFVVSDIVIVLIAVNESEQQKSQSEPMFRALFYFNFVLESSFNTIDWEILM